MAFQNTNLSSIMVSKKEGNGEQLDESVLVQSNFWCQVRQGKWGSGRAPLAPRIGDCWDDLFNLIGMLSLEFQIR